MMMVYGRFVSVCLIYMCEQFIFNNNNVKILLIILAKLVRGYILCLKSRLSFINFSTEN